MIQMPENKRNVPQVLTCLDGTDVKDSRTWFEKRRPEILELFQREEYGRLPDMGDVEIKIRVADSRQGAEIMEGRAVVHWKLFDTTLDGNEYEVCIPIIDGVSYGCLLYTSNASSI